MFHKRGLGVLVAAVALFVMGGNVFGTTGDGIPELLYNDSTGEVTINPDGADVISFALVGGPFVAAADFSGLPAGLTDNIASQVGWTSFNLFTGATTPANLGPILPAGLDLAGLASKFTTATFGISLGSGGGGGDLQLIIPEPASIALLGLGGAMIIRRRRAA